MDQNDKEIELLNSNPGELLTSYQDLVTIIVRKYRRLGYVPNRETEDLIQETNRRLLERIPRIQKQYNGKSRLRTYFSVIIRNICLEEVRKRQRLEEPKPPDYHKLDQAVDPGDAFLIKQEYERYEKVLRLLFKDKARFVVMLRYLLDLNLSEKLILELFPLIQKDSIGQILTRLSIAEEITKKAKFERLSKVLAILEDQTTSPESLRKWFASRSKEFLNLMNGDPPRSAYTLETMQLLIENYENSKNNQ